MKHNNEPKFALTRLDRILVVASATVGFTVGSMIGPVDTEEFPRALQSFSEPAPVVTQA